MTDDADCYSRRGFIAKTGSMLLFAMIALPDAAKAKLSKSKAGYTPGPRGRQNCANCTLYNKNNRTCTVVKGTFSPNAWCKLWVKK